MDNEGSPREEETQVVDIQTDKADVNSEVHSDNEESDYKRRRLEGAEGEDDPAPAVETAAEDEKADGDENANADADAKSGNKDDTSGDSANKSDPPSNDKPKFRPAHKPSAFWGGDGQPPARLNNLANLSFEEYEKLWQEATTARYKVLLQEQKDGKTGNSGDSNGAPAGPGMIPGQMGAMPMGMMGPGSFGMPGQMGGGGSNRGPSPYGPG